MDTTSTATSKTTINLVVSFLGVFALAALAAVTFLIDRNASAANVAIIVGPMGVALGAVGGILSTSRSPVASQLPVVTPPEQIADPPAATVGVSGGLLALDPAAV
jgi:hypothetical protein